jgi:hypothetical protein
MNEFGLSAAITPAVIPKTSAMESAIRPSRMETGNVSKIISFTVRLVYFIEGPRSPLPRRTM